MSRTLDHYVCECGYDFKNVGSLGDNDGEGYPCPKCGKPMKCFCCDDWNDDGTCTCAKPAILEHKKSDYVKAKRVRLTELRKYNICYEWGIDDAADFVRSHRDEVPQNAGSEFVDRLADGLLKLKEANNE